MASQLQEGKKENSFYSKPLGFQYKVYYKKEAG